jgi:hypothetical protein
VSTEEIREEMQRICSEFKDLQVQIYLAQLAHLPALVSLKKDVWFLFVVQRTSYSG